MKIFKNKFFIFLLACAVFIIILSTTLAAMGRIDPLKEALTFLSKPFTYLGEKIEEGFSGFGKYFATIGSLQDENESLKEQINVLEKDLADADALRDENKRLRDYMAIKKTYPSFSLCEAAVISKGSENYATIYTLNRGSGDGIKLGMPVMTKDGLVGSICELSYSSCKVRVISEASASVGAYVSRTGEIGVIEGDIGLKGTNTCYLSYLPNESEVEIGDLIYTSGEGSIYPRDLLIGRVTSVETDPYLRTVRATVEIAADLQNLDYVLIVTDFEITEETETIASEGD